MKKLLMCLLCSMLLLLPGTVYAVEDFMPSFDMCTVVRVIDGDTFEANCRYRGDGVKVRVLGIDTYESRENSHLAKQLGDNVTKEQALAKGRYAKHCAQRFLKDTAVVLVFPDRRYDMYNRLLSKVYVVVGSRRFVSYTRLLRKYCRQGIYK